MKKCHKCNQLVEDNDLHQLNNKLLCEDCYIDTVMPRMPKVHYDDDTEFMRRLQGSYSVRKQQFH